MGFGGAESWRIMKPTHSSLMTVMSYAMSFSPALLSPHIDPHEYWESLQMQNSYRAVSHGM